MRTCVRVRVSVVGNVRSLGCYRMHALFSFCCFCLESVFLYSLSVCVSLSLSLSLFFRCLFCFDVVVGIFACLLCFSSNCFASFRFCFAAYRFKVPHVCINVLLIVTKLLFRFQSTSTTKAVFVVAGHLILIPHSHGPFPHRKTDRGLKKNRSVPWGHQRKQGRINCGTGADKEQTTSLTQGK